MTKKNILKISSVYILYIVFIFSISFLCNKNFCEIREDDFFGVILLSFAPLLFVFFFSLITYKMKEEVFRAWWNFARWWVGIIILVSIFFNVAGGDGGGGMGGGGLASGILDFAVMWLLYGVLVIGSIVKIFRVYFR